MHKTPRNNDRILLNLDNTVSVISPINGRVWQWGLMKSYMITVAMELIPELTVDNVPAYAANTKRLKWLSIKSNFIRVDKYFYEYFKMLYFDQILIKVCVKILL